MIRFSHSELITIGMAVMHANNPKTLLRALESTLLPAKIANTCTPEEIRDTFAKLMDRANKSEFAVGLLYVLLIASLNHEEQIQLRHPEALRWEPEIRFLLTRRVITTNSDTFTPKQLVLLSQNNAPGGSLITTPVL